VDHPIQGLMKTAMESIKGMVDVNTVVGQAVHTQDGTVIIPVSSVSLGFAAGGSDFGRSERAAPEAALPFGGGSGAGVSVRPVGFLVVPREGHIRLLPVDERATFEHLVDTAPELLERLRQMWSRDGAEPHVDGRGNGRRTAEPVPDIALPGER
jgi:sporulation protein YtfJ